MRPAFEFFAGKGGVGKTTCAAARAIDAARTGERVLVVSTDPAHSLGDALGLRVAARLTPVRLSPPARRGGALTAIELDAARALGRWRRTHRQALGEVIEHGTWLDRDDVETLIALPVPGVDELLGMLEIVRLAGRAAYDRVVVDTAPTGHTLRLFAAPETVGTVAHVLAGLQQEHRLIREQLARVVRPEAADRLIELLTAQAEDTRALLRNTAGTAIHWVTAPEDLSLAEMSDGISALAGHGILVRDIIVNRVVADGPPCPICDVRRDAERAALARWCTGAIARLPRRILFDRIREPRGARLLAALGVRLRNGDEWHQRAPARSRRRTDPRMRLSAAARRPARFLESMAPVQLLFFGGKGGVGKTTVASATAVRLARQSTGRVLLLSTDPAHSLGDAFNQPLDDRATTIAGGPPDLDVRELDAAAAFAARRTSLQAAVAEVTNLRADAALGAVTELLDLAPPGVDELFGVLSVVDARATYRTIVVDTAPTGHALRLLEMPESARQWVQALLQMLIKYRDMVRPGRLAAELVDLSKSVRAFSELLRDPRRARFVVVTRAAHVPARETERLVRRLRQLRLAVPAVIVNARTLAPGSCRRCRATAAREQRELRSIERTCRRMRPPCAIIQTPLAAPPPRTLHALERWADAWM